MIFCPGLLLVDHIHFQYNGFLFAILVYSIGCLIRERYILGALLFAILLCFKHIFVYTAPVYLVYLFSQYVLQLHQTFAARAVAFLKLGISVLSVVAAAFAPFVYQGQLWIVLERLFPFGDRGLCHAYWAPNVWALYNVVDKVLEKLLQVPVDPEAVSMTSGLVENFQHSVLPEVTPLHTLGLTVFTMLPALWILARNPTKATFLTALSCVTFSSFLFGWHVHEKAILMVLVPLTLVCCESELAAKLFYLLTLSGTYSLFPLLFTMPEELIKVCLLVAFLLLAHLILTHSLATTTGQTLRLNILEQLYCVGFVGLHLVVVALPFVLPELQFLGLMLISVYTAVGVCHAYVLSWKLLLQANMATKAKQD
jgi:alpha-1,3-glucosyltransferase